MRTKIFAVWMAACVITAAKPGDLDRSFDPEMRAWVAPDHVTIAGDGRAWIGGGFDRADADSTGDMLTLGENGGVESEPATGYLKRVEPHVAIAAQTGAWAPQDAAVARPFLLENGDFLLSGESGGWLRMNAAGRVVGKAFSDRQTAEVITPQFESNGRLWVIRQLADGGRIVERRASADGSPDGGFSQAGALPRNVKTAVPGPDGGAWVLAGDGIPWFYFSEGYDKPLPEQRIIRVDANGSPVSEPRVIAVPRTLALVAGPAGAFRLTYGADQSWSGYWPGPTSTRLKIEWYSAGGALERTKDFNLPLYETFAWAEAADGSFVATDARTRIAGSSQYYVAKVASLRRYEPDGVEDPAFVSPGPVRSVKPLADGKWLIDGLRRLNADGSEDSSWTAPGLSRPAVVKTLLALPGGRVLVAGDFATADGLVRNRLVVFRSNGAVDDLFIPDDRIGEWRSLTVSGGAIYVVTSEPVVYGDGAKSNLVKLRPDGTLDESFLPRVFTGFLSGGLFYYPATLAPGNGITLLPPSPLIPVATVVNVANVSGVVGVAGGDILVETYSNFGDFYRSGLTRLKADGSPAPGFRQPENFPGLANTLALKSGGFVAGAIFYRADGTVERDLTEPNRSLVPLCECPGGILFQASDDTQTRRLALWTRHGFARWFQPPALDWNKSVAAAPGELGTIYLAATLMDGKPSVHRLLPNGRIDRAFRGPVFGNRERQSGCHWWKAEESGKVTFDPARTANEVAPPVFRSYSQVLLWHPASRRVWTGGDFNMADGKPRDGLARITGGVSSWRWW